jgi:hypothetical protein
MSMRERNRERKKVKKKHTLLSLILKMEVLRVYLLHSRNSLRSQASTKSKL